MNHQLDHPDPNALQAAWQQNEWPAPSVKIVHQTDEYTVRVVDPSLGDVPEWYEVDIQPGCSAPSMAEAVGLIPADFRPDSSDVLDMESGAVLTIFFTRNSQAR